MKQVSRYHPLLVTLHWVLAVLIIAALTIGFFVLAATPNADPQKIGVLRIHMAGGMLILALMVIRFIVRMLTLRPAGATTGYPLLDRIAPITHYGFYVLVLLMGERLHDWDSCGAPGDRVRWLRCPAAALLRDLSELCGTRLYCDDPCRLHRFARACRALPSIRYERRIIPANVLRATCPKSLDSDGMIAPINDSALQAGDVSAIRLCHVAFGSWSCGNARPGWHTGRTLVRGWLCPDRGHKRPDTHDVHDTGEIVGEYVQRHL